MGELTGMIAITLQTTVSELGFVPDRCSKTIKRILSEAGVIEVMALGMALDESRKVGSYYPLIRTIKDIETAEKPQFVIEFEARVSTGTHATENSTYYLGAGFVAVKEKARANVYKTTFEAEKDAKKLYESIRHRNNLLSVANHSVVKYSLKLKPENHSRCKTCLGEGWFHDNCDEECGNNQQVEPKLEPTKGYTCEKCPDCK